jgi:branched-chain amino acid transport system substrate-binding protein
MNSAMVRVVQPALAGLVTVLLATSSAAAGQKAGPVTDDIGVITIPKGTPIQIAGYWVLSGPDSALGIDQKRGVEIAIKDFGGKLVGRPIKFTAEDSLCTPEGGQTAATKIAANPNNVIVLGPSCSSEATAAAPVLWNAGLTDIGTSTSAPALTAADRKPAYDGYARTVFSDVDEGPADANFLLNVLKAKKIVTVNDGSPYSVQLTEVMVKHFKEIGGTVLSQEAIAPTDVDMHPLLERIAVEKPDAIYLPLFVAAAGQIIRQAKETNGLENTILLGGAGLMAADMIQAAGPAVVGFKIAYPDLSPASMGKFYPKFVEEYEKAYTEAPISGYHANAYDAAVLAFKAIEEVAITDENGVTYIGKKALRDAVFASHFDGVSGEIACDPHGQCAKFHFAAYEYTSANPKTYDVGKNPKKIYP